MTESDKIAEIEQEFVRIILKVRPALESYQELKHRILILLNMQIVFLQKKSTREAEDSFTQEAEDSFTEDMIIIEGIISATIKKMQEQPDLYGMAE